MAEVGAYILPLSPLIFDSNLFPSGIIKMKNQLENKHLPLKLLLLSSVGQTLICLLLLSSKNGNNSSSKKSTNGTKFLQEIKQLDDIAGKKIRQEAKQKKREKVKF